MRTKLSLKPPMGSQIDWGLAINRGLLMYCPFNEGGGYYLQNLAQNDQGIFCDNGGYGFPTDDFVWGTDNGGTYALNGSTNGAALHQWMFRASNRYDINAGFTMAGRCKFVTSGGEYARLLGRYKISDGSSDWAILCVNNNVNWYIAVTGAWGSSAITSVASVGGIEFIAVTHDGSNIRIYINGELKNTTGASGAITNTAGNDVLIGNCLNGLSSPGKWSTPIYSTYVWNRCLGVDELRWLNDNPYGLTYNPNRRYSVQGAVPLTQSVSDQINTMADAQSNSGYARAAFGFSDFMQLLDSVAIFGGDPDFQRSFGDNLNHLQDLLSLPTFAILKTFSDNLNNLLDNVVALLGIPIAAFDSNQFNWADSVLAALIGTLEKTASDSANNLADSASVSLLNVPFLVSVSDSLNNLNDAIRLWNVLKVLSGDQMVFSDALQAKMNHLLRLSEVLSTFLENLGIAVVNKPTFADQLVLSDAISLSMAAEVTASASDQLSMSDAVVLDNQGNYNPASIIDRIRRYLNDPQ